MSDEEDIFAELEELYTPAATGPSSSRLSSSSTAVTRTVVKPVTVPKVLTRTAPCGHSGPSSSILNRRDSNSQSETDSESALTRHLARFRFHQLNLLSNNNNNSISSGPGPPDDSEELDEEDSLFHPSLPLSGFPLV